ncbi:hypothetical protein K0M31_015156 [Melipona bicolor]|uniref:Uncharacterized protein n=1 Tax=Melipona bicolor TaxID=60889 RepID=A0AA40FGG5_9HYME|nr:hypothetical protein K0M31_015151 [Melipona bicolor]KAK1118454.1 hypothetical protein K0M31_015152 [Melipona bicolor]KAK1118458.1 hypothetical protein K0M31_015156 [Melipona bicolor]
MAESRTARLVADVGTANNLFGLRFVYKSARVSEWHTHTEPEMGDTCSLRCTNEEMEPCIVDFREDLNSCRVLSLHFEEKQRWECVRKIEKRLSKVAAKRERKRRMQ